MSFRRNKTVLSEIQDRVETLNCKDIPTQSLQSLGHGTYNDTFTMDFQGNPTVLRVSYYSPMTVSAIGKMLQTYGQDLQDAKRRAWRLIHRDAVSIKNNFAKITNFFIEKDICPHFVFSFGSKDCKKLYERIQSKIPTSIVRGLSAESKRYNNVSFSELFETDMWKIFDRIDKNDIRLPESELRSVIFQVLYSLAVMQHYIPGFRHNDLSLPNILVKWNLPETYIYEIHGSRYRVANTRIFAAVNDFDFAHAETHIIHLGGENVRIPLCNSSIMYDTFRTNPNVGARRINRLPNQSFDSNIFLFQIMQRLESLLRASRNTFIYDDTLRFLRSLQMTGKYQERPNMSMNPATLLNHSFFGSMRTTDTRVDFSIRSNVPFEIYIGPGACSSNVEIPDGVRTEYVQARDAVVLPNPAQPDPIIFRYGYEDMMTDFDAALIIKSCDDLDTKVLSVLKKRFGAVSCQQLRDIVKQKYENDVQDEVGQLVQNCSAFFTRKELLEFARRQAPGVDLRYKTKGQLCDLIQIHMLGKVVKSST